MAVVYYLSFAYFDKNSFLNRNEPTDFREKLIKAKSSKTSILKLICFEDECILEEDGRIVGDFTLDAKMYFFDIKGDEIEREYLESEMRYAKKPKFVYALYPNGVFDEAIMQSGGEYTVLGPLVWIKQEGLKTLEEAKKVLINEQYKSFGVAD